MARFVASAEEVVPLGHRRNADMRTISPRSKQSVGLPWAFTDAGSLSSCTGGVKITALVLGSQDQSLCGTREHYLR